MTRCSHVIALGLIALCFCASSPALSQGRTSERRPRQEPLGAYILQTEEDARRQLDSEEETRQAEGALDTVRCWTIIIGALIVIFGAALGLLGYRKLKRIQAVRKEAEEAVKKAS